MKFKTNFDLFEKILYFNLLATFCNLLIEKPVDVLF